MELFRSYVYANNTLMRLQSFLIDYLKGKKPVFLCLGTDKLVGDCLAPLCATKLRKLNLPYYIYGGLEAPITSQNATFAYEFIRTIHSTSTIILIDSMATRSQANLGDIVITNNYISAINTINIKPDLCIYGVTSLLHNNLLNCARLNNVEKIADTMSTAISNALSMIQVVPNLKIKNAPMC